MALKSKYPLISLGEVAKVHSGFAFKSSDMGNSGYPIIKIKNINPPNVDIENCDYIAEEIIQSIPNFDRYLLHSGDTLIAMTGATAGKVGRFYSDSNNYFVNQRVGKVHIFGKNLSNAEYIYQILRTKKFSQDILALSSGSAQGNISSSQIEKYKIPLPPIEIQNSIGNILGTLDKKIRLNKKTNQTLEEVAKSLFKSWFIDFDPVKAKAEDCSTELPDEINDLFPDSFEDSELGEIPSGWKLGNIDQIAMNPKVIAKPYQMDCSDRYIGLEHMPRKSIELADSGTAENLASNKNVFNKGDILYGKLRPYFKKTGLAQFDGVCSTDIVVIREKFKLCRGFICFLLASNPFIDFTVALSSGTRMPRTSWNQMCEFLLPIPKLTLVQIFGEIVSPMLDKIRTNSEQSNILSSVRDELLSKLISGELRITDAEKIIDEAGT